MYETSKTVANQHNYERVVHQKRLEEGDWSAGQHEDVADDADDADDADADDADEDDDDVAFWDILWQCGVEMSSAATKTLMCLSIVA